MVEMLRSEYWRCTSVLALSQDTQRWICHGTHLSMALRQRSRSHNFLQNLNGLDVGVRVLGTLYFCISTVPIERTLDLTRDSRY